MALIKRIDKGSPITAVEMDANLQYLEDSITAGTSGTSGTSGAGTSGTSGTRGTSGSSGSSGSSGTSGAGTSGSSGTSGAGTSGTSGTSGAGTSGSSGTSGAGTSGTSGTSGISGAGSSLSLFDGATRLTAIEKITLSGLTVLASGSGGATITSLGGGGGSTINVQSGSTTISSVSTLRVDATTMTLANNGGGTVTIGAISAGGGGSAGSAGTNGTSGTSGTSISLTLRKDALTLDSIRNITLSGSIFLDVSGSGGALLRVESGGIPVVLSGVVSSSQQIVGYDTFAVKSSANSFNGTQTVTGSIVSTGIISGSDLYVQNSPNFAIPQGNIMVGSSGNRSAFLPTSSLAFNGLTVTDQGMNITFTDKTKLAFTNDFLVSTSGSDGVLISSLGGGGGSGAGFPFSGSAVITGSLLVSGSLTTTGPITAPTFAISSVGTPTVESATNINLTAGNAVVITSSSLRLAIFTDAQTSSITAQNGDMIYNSTAHKFMGYASGSWVQLH
jgi:hypothetical protein